MAYSVPILEDPRVQCFLQDHKFEKTQIHGCAYGPKAPCGTPVTKPWTLASNDITILERMTRTCPGDGVHPKRIPCTGNICKRSELYTTDLTNAFHRSLSRPSPSSVTTSSLHLLQASDTLLLLPFR